MQVAGGRCAAIVAALDSHRELGTAETVTGNRASQPAVQHVTAPVDTRGLLALMESLSMNVM